MNVGATPQGARPAREEPRAEDRPGDLDDRAQELPVALLGLQDAGGDRCSQVISGHCDPIMFVAVR